MTVGQAEHSYGEVVNTRLLDFIGALQGTVLDVGSGTGAWGPALRARGAERLLAIEPSDDALVVRERYDDVFPGVIADAPGAFYAGVSTIVVADVLEHLPDPWSALRELRAVAKPGTRLIVSLPNAQCARMLLPIMLTGRFEYSNEGGWLDVGHLRWFTQRTLDDSLRRTGWEPSRHDGHVLGRVAKLIMTASRGRASGLAYYQLHVEAVAV